MRPVLPHASLPHCQLPSVSLSPVALPTASLPRHAVCPFMVTGELVQEWRSSLWPDVSFAKWPKQAAEKWGPWLMLALFSGILVWEDVWELNDNAYLTGSLLALITAGGQGASLLLSSTAASAPSLLISPASDARSTRPGRH